MLGRFIILGSIVTVFSFSLIGSTQAEVLATHVGNTDPATEGWTFDDFNGGTGTQSGGTDTEDYWRIQRDEAAAGRYLFAIADPNQAFNNPNGWTITARVKANVTASTDDVSFSVWDQTHRWSMHLLPNGVWSMAQNWALGALLGNVDTTDYHTYQMVYDPVSETVSYFVDGAYLNGSGRDDVPPITGINRVDFGDSNGLLASDSQWSYVQFETGTNLVTPLEGDLNNDSYVNLQDFVVIASQWLMCNNPADPDCDF